MIATADLVAFLRAPSEDAALIASLRASAIAYIERTTGAHFGPLGPVTETHRWHGGPLVLNSEPRGPVTLERWDGNAWSAMDAATYYADGNLVYPNASWWGGHTRFRVTFDAGYDPDAGDPGDPLAEPPVPATPGDPDVWAAPDDIKHAVRLLVGHWYENREAVVVGAQCHIVPMAADALIAPYRKVFA
jgi:hypothetical protein